jgi:hypothetical protein
MSCSELQQPAAGTRRGAAESGARTLPEAAPAGATSLADGPVELRLAAALGAGGAGL